MFTCLSIPTSPARLQNPDQTKYSPLSLVAFARKQSDPLPDVLHSALQFQRGIWLSISLLPAFLRHAGSSAQTTTKFTYNTNKSSAKAYLCSLFSLIAHFWAQNLKMLKNTSQGAKKEYSVQLCINNMVNYLPDHNKIKGKSKGSSPKATG